MLSTLRGVITSFSQLKLSTVSPPIPPSPLIMATAAPLFTLPILLSPATVATGSIVCTSPEPNVYLLTFTSPPDNRLLTGFCQAFLLALDIIEFSHPPGVVITTSGIPKFYSNGLDLEHAVSTKGFWTDSLFSLFKRLLTYVFTLSHTLADGD